MSSEVALRRIAGSFSGAADLSLDDVKKQIQARYPHAAASPARESVDGIMAEYGFDWEPELVRYQPRATSFATSHRSSALSTTMAGESGQSFQDRLERSRDRFLALTAQIPRVAHAERVLSTVDRVTSIQLDSALIEHMKAIATEKGAAWESVLQLDADGPEHRNWSILANLVDEASQRLHDQLLSTPGTVLATRAGLLARYDRLGMLEEVRRQVDAAGADLPLKGLWLLVPTSGGPPVIDGTPLPVIDENEWVHVPTEWLESRT
jgi:hypothetical protein